MSKMRYDKYAVHPITKSLTSFYHWLDKQTASLGVWFKHHSQVRWFAIAILLAIACILVATQWLKPSYELVFNRSNSLPGYLYFLDKTQTPHCGDFTVFEMPYSARFYKGWRIIKKIAGCEGDVVTIKNREVFINDHSFGKAKLQSSDHRYDLFVTYGGVIPPHKVYLAAFHPNSYDSRYASVGLRDEKELLGRAFLIF